MIMIINVNASHLQLLNMPACNENERNHHQPEYHNVGFKNANQIDNQKFDPLHSLKQRKGGIKPLPRRLWIKQRSELRGLKY